jgi:hypothetical protein
MSSEDKTDYMGCWTQQRWDWYLYGGLGELGAPNTLRLEVLTLCVGDIHTLQ